MSNSFTYFVGIDIAKSSFDVCFFNSQVIKHIQFPNTQAGFKQLCASLPDNESIHLCMEATGAYGQALAIYLFEQNYAISVVNPFAIKSFARSRLLRNKTDKIDAFLIAQYAQLFQPPLWKPLPEAYQHLKDLVNRRKDLQTIRRQEANRLSERSWSLAASVSLRQHLAFLDTAIKTIEHELKSLARQFSDIHQSATLLSTIPGIGWITALTLLAEIGPIDRFNNVRQVVAFAGLNPKQHSSGSSVQGRTTLSKQGSTSLRTCLFMPAIVARKHNPIIRRHCLQLEARGKPKMVSIGAAMRKLLHIAFGVLKSGKPFDPDFHAVFP